MTTQDNTVVAFPTKPDGPAPSSFERIWGKKVKSHGYAAIPTILIRSQHRLGINSTQFVSPEALRATLTEEGIL